MGESLVNRPALAANGTLAKTPLLHLVLYVADKKLTGTIEFFAPDKTASAAAYFMGGEPAKVRTNPAGHYLGHVLRDLGFLSEDQLTRSVAELQAEKAKAAAPALHGQLLLERRMIDRAKLELGLRTQVARKLAQIASMPPATAYGFYDNFDGLRGWGMQTDQGFDPMPMLWSVLRASPPADHLAAGLGRLRAGPARLSKGADIARFALDERERGALGFLRDHPMRAPELSSATGLPVHELELLLYLMLLTKQIEIVRASGQMPIAGEPAPTAATATPAKAVAAPNGAGHTAGIASPAGASAARRSTPSAPRQPVAPAQAPATLAPELASRWTEIVERATTIERADYFSMLELPRSATKDEVEASFFGLAKKWHPDRLPAELAPVRDACSRVFARMSEARGTLVDEERRTRYVTLLADGSGSPESQDAVARVLEAATDFQKAEVCFKRNDLPQAEALCRKAVDLDPTQAGYHALLAWLIALKPENQSSERIAGSVKMLDRAIAMNKNLEHAHYWRGMLHKRIGKDDAALRDFKTAVELNPRDIDAAREVRLFQMRGKGTGSGRPPEHSRTAARSSSSAAPPKRDSAKPSLKPGTKASPKPSKLGLLDRLFKKH
jgi:tetratricopeptide (TPR) repeat protein